MKMTRRQGSNPGDQRAFQCTLNHSLTRASEFDLHWWSITDLSKNDMLDPDISCKYRRTYHNRTAMLCKSFEMGHILCFPQTYSFICASGSEQFTVAGDGDRNNIIEMADQQRFILQSIDMVQSHGFIDFADVPFFYYAVFTC